MALAPASTEASSSPWIAGQVCGCSVVPPRVDADVNAMSHETAEKSEGGSSKQSPGQQLRPLGVAIVVIPLAVIWAYLSLLLGFGFGSPRWTGWAQFLVSLIGCALAFLAVKNHSSGHPGRAVRFGMSAVIAAAVWLIILFGVAPLYE